MDILLLGSGGREHALAWKLRQSPHCGKLYIAPGNAGTALCGENVAFAATDLEGIRAFCRESSIGMVVVGPEEPLVLGIYDAFRSDPSVSHIPVIGPSKAGAQLEGSKAFAKAFMQRHGIPTAAYREFGPNNTAEAAAYLDQHQLPIVIKADGLAAGKGVVIAETVEEARQAYEAMGARFGAAGARVVVEQFLSGIELSVFVLTDGKHWKLLPEAKDYKRIGEGDKGPNTGGMGAISPVPFADQAFMRKVIDRVVEPTVGGLRKEGIDYKGFLFLGLINVGGDPFVIEYNCRMGDPETEAVMPRLKNDLVDLLEAVAAGKLGEMSIETDPRTAVTVVAVSGGYPGAYAKGLSIEGLPGTEPHGTGSGPGTVDSWIFQAGTREYDGSILTDGGRVLAATGLAENATLAVKAARARLAKIRFEGMYFRKDIGYEFQ